MSFERSTKLVLYFTLGRRNQSTTDVFIEGLHDTVRPGRHFQIITDGFTPYVSAITTTIGHILDFARRIRVCNSKGGEARYSPAEVASTEVTPAWK